jgi:hypothetical protein
MNYLQSASLTPLYEPSGRRGSFSPFGALSNLPALPRLISASPPHLGWQNSLHLTALRNLRANMAHLGKQGLVFLEFVIRL